MSVLKGSTIQAQAPNEDALHEQEKILEAELQGHSFIKLKYKKSYRKDMPIVIGPVWTLQEYRNTTIRDGATTMNLILRMGKLWFRWDPLQRSHVAYLLDDKEPGCFSEKGWNRDFLATHYTLNEWEILTEEVKDDILIRIELSRAVQAKKKEGLAKKDEGEIDILAIDEKDIEKQIAFLQAQKAAIGRAKNDQKEMVNSVLEKAKEDVARAKVATQEDIVVAPEPEESTEAEKTTADVVQSTTDVTSPKAPKSKKKKLASIA